MQVARNGHTISILSDRNSRRCSTDPVFDSWAAASSCFSQTVRYEGMNDRVTIFVEVLSMSFSGDKQD